MMAMLTAACGGDGDKKEIVMIDMRRERKRYLMRERRGKIRIY